ncbi:MAG: PCP reductase family protein [bacterium]
MTAVEQRFKTIDVREHDLSYTCAEQTRTYPRERLPSEFTQWMIEGRKAMYDLLEGNASAPFFGSHLPVVVTYNRDGGFPFNTGNKGVGLMPVPGKVDDYSDLYEETYMRCHDMPWEESLPHRLEAVRSFIESEDWSNEALVSLEIFEKTTFANLAANPIATLHFTGDGPMYRSYQINAVVQVVPPEHPVYRFTVLSRQLFEFDDFHITQTQFPYAYIFYPVQVYDKTPYAREAAEMTKAVPKAWAEMTLVWEDAVLRQLRRAPSFIQKFIIKITEEFARETGENSVNEEMFHTVRARYMNKRKPGPGTMAEGHAENPASS